jgi:beta-lactamase regulating signal transducer with metallopeptidase domain
MTEAIFLWPLAYLVHSTLLLVVAWVASRWIRHAALAEALWRCAFFGAFVTATWQPLSLLAAAPAPVFAPAAAQAPPRASPVARAPTPPTTSATPLPVVRTERTVAPASAWRWWLPQETREWLLASTLAWALVALGGLAVLLVQWTALARRCRRLRPNVDAGWSESVRTLARHYGLKHVPELRTGARWASPLVGPRGVVCLPDWCLAQMHGPQRDAVLAHELAHLARRDPAWRIASRLGACIGWMQPLNAIALRRLDALAEQACDARAARAIADRHAVAEALYACASQLQSGGRAPRLHVGMAASRSPLLRRIETLLHPDPAQDARTVSRRAWAVGAAILVGGACLLPVLRVQGDELRATEWRDFVDDVLPAAGSRTHVMTRSPDERIDLWIRGDARLRDDSDELKSGQVSLRETTGGVTRRLDIDADAGAGTLPRFRLDGAPHPLDADAKRWVEMRWNMVMGTLLNPQQRVERLLRRGGPEGVMQAIEKPADIETQRVLVEAYAGNRTLDEATVQRLIAAVDRAEPGGDDHDRLLSLRDIARRQQLTPGQQQQFLAALATRTADSESVGALQALLLQLDDPAQATTLGAAVAMLRALPSDNARREVLDTALDRGASNAAGLALQVTPGFTSDFDHRELLEHVARHLASHRSAELAQRYADSARQLKSSFERRTALLALIEATPLDQDGCLAVLNALEGVAAPPDLTPVLLALARRMPVDNVLIARYRQLARVLPPYERGQTEQALDALPAPA